MCVKTVYDLYILQEQMCAPHVHLSEDLYRPGMPAPSRVFAGA